MEILFGLLVMCLALLVRKLFRKWKAKRPSQGPALDDIPRFYLESKDVVDPGKFYVVVVDLDMGFIHAYFERRRSPAVTEFVNFDEAGKAAQEESIDSLEHERMSFVYRGRTECLAIYRGGKAVSSREFLCRDYDPEIR